jgi:AcrR family transcriptional regulator
VSPAPARTSLEDIVSAGRSLLEREGPDAVTMLAVAQQVGVKAPSLYKRLRDRNALLAAIATATAEELGAEIAAKASGRNPVATLRAIAHAYRAYALAHPRSVELLFADLPADARPTPETNAAVAAPIVEAAGRVAGPEHALEAARLVTAFARGFTSMETAGAFRLGGDVDEAYDYGVDVLVDALAARATDRRRPPTRRRQDG